MKEINFIITIYNREDYWEYLKKILDNYKKIKSNYVVCYSGDRDDFECDVRIKNEPNGGRGSDNHANACLHADMDYKLTIKGYDFLKKNNVNDWIKLSVDSWLLDENKILEILEYMKSENCMYGGNIWYSHINLSTDVFFANTRYSNIFEDLKLHGQKFLDWLYEKKIPTGFENLMRYMVIPYNHAIIMDREPINPDSTRWICHKLGWCMSHDLSVNLNFMAQYVSDNHPVSLVKIIGNCVPYNFEWYLEDSGQKIN